MKNTKLNANLALFRCCLCCACSMGLVYNCFGIFFSPIAKSLDFTVGSLSVIVTLRSLSTAFFSLVFAKLMRRYEIRWLMSGGVLLCCVVYFLMAFSSELWQFYSLGLLAGIAYASFSVLPVSFVLQIWFKESAGSVTSIAMAFSGLMGALFNPICSAIIESYGWQIALCVIGLLVFILSFPCTLTMKMPDDFQLKSNEPKQYKKEKLSMDWKTFIILCSSASIFTMGICLNNHMSAFGISIGYDLSFSAKMVSMVMIGNIVSKLIMGKPCDRFGPITITILCAGISISGMLLLFLAKIPIIALIACFMYGFIFFCSSVGSTQVTRLVAGRENYADVYSKVTVCTSVSSAVIISLIGFGYDFFGSYNIVIIILIAILFYGIYLCSSLKKTIH